jgi:dolichyl-phosphate-mannose-protein mannosyltransferase
MGIVEGTPGGRRFWVGVFLVGLVAGLILRLQLASFARMPGHGDSAFYFTVARNIAEGRGPVVDYITYFFSGLLPLPHYAGDFWNPTASFLIAIPMLLFSKSISAALLAPIAAGIVPAIAGFLAGRHYTGSIVGGALAGILTFFSAFEVWFSVTTEAIIFAGAFGALALYFMMRQDPTGRYFLLAALFTGLANLIRQDNILLLVTLEACVLLASLPIRTKVQLALAALAIHVLVLSPLLVMNYSQLHTVFPAGPGKTAFLTNYEDFHSYNKEIDWATLRATWGIQGIIKRRFHTAGENLGQVQYFLTPLLAVLIIAALLELLIRRDKARLRLLLPAALFALLEYLFYSFVASFSGPGSLIKGLAALLPFFCTAIVGLFVRYIRNGAILLALVAGISAFSAYQGYSKNLESTLYYNGVYTTYSAVRTTILNDAQQKGIDARNVIILARNTWDVYEGTGFRTVMVPNNDIDTIVFVARYYGARYILLPANRPQLDKIYKGLTPDPRFQLVARVPDSDLKIYSLVYNP